MGLNGFIRRPLGLFIWGLLQKRTFPELDRREFVGALEGIQFGELILDLSLRLAKKDPVSMPLPGVLAQENL